MPALAIRKSTIAVTDGEASIPSNQEKPPCGQAQRLSLARSSASGTPVPAETELPFRRADKALTYRALTREIALSFSGFTKSGTASLSISARLCSEYSAP